MWLLGTIYWYEISFVMQSVGGVWFFKRALYVDVLIAYSIENISANTTTVMLLIVWCENE